MVTTLGKSIDMTESYAGGVNHNTIAGSGGVTVGQTVKWDGTNANTVVACSGITDKCIGVAGNTAAVGAAVNVLGYGCTIQTALTITVGADVEPSTTGYLQTWTSGTIIGTCIDGTTSASIVRLCPARC